MENWLKYGLIGLVIGLLVDSYMIFTKAIGFGSSLGFSHVFLILGTLISSFLIASLLAEFVKRKKNQEKLSGWLIGGFVGSLIVCLISLIPVSIAIGLILYYLFMLIVGLILHPELGIYALAPLFLGNFLERGIFFFSPLSDIPIGLFSYLGYGSILILAGLLIGWIVGLLVEAVKNIRAKNENIKFKRINFKPTLLKTVISLLLSLYLTYFLSGFNRMVDFCTHDCSYTFWKFLDSFIHPGIFWLFYLIFVAIIYSIWSLLQKRKVEA
jgi:hypothetical protein